MAYLTTRVRAPDEDDYKKLTRVMKYLRESIDKILMLEADAMHLVNWWVDASFAVHHDLKSHMGATMSHNTEFVPPAPPVRPPSVFNVRLHRQP